MTREPQSLPSFLAHADKIDILIYQLVCRGFEPPALRRSESGGDGNGAPGPCAAHAAGGQPRLGTRGGAQVLCESDGRQQAIAAYHPVVTAGDALLRKTRLPALRKNQGLLREAADRISKSLALESLRPSSKGGRKQFLLLGGFEHLTILDATGGQHFDFGFLLTRHVCARLGCND